MNAMSIVSEIASFTETFLVVAETRSFSKAAQQLSMSPSAVSQKISQLEDKLHVTLFDRSTRPLINTPEARMLKETIERYNSEIEQTIQAIQLKKNKLPEIRFGMIHSITDCIGTELIKNLSEKTYKVKHLMGTSDILLKRLHNNETDIIVTSGNLSNEPDLITKVIFIEPLIIAAPSSIKLLPSSLECISALSHSRLPLIRSPFKSGSGRDISEFLAKHSLDIPNRLEIDCNLIHLEMIAQGLAWTISYPTSFIKNRDLWTKIHFEYIPNFSRKITLACTRNTSKFIFDYFLNQTTSILRNDVVSKIKEMIPATKEINFLI